MFTKWLKEALLEVKFEITQSIDFDAVTFRAAGQYITLPTHSYPTIRATKDMLRYKWVCGSGKDCGP